MPRHLRDCHDAGPSRAVPPGADVAFVATEGAEHHPVCGFPSCPLCGEEAVVLPEAAGVVRAARVPLVVAVAPVTPFTFRPSRVPARAVPRAPPLGSLSPFRG